MASSDSRRSELSVKLEASESNFRKHVDEIGEILNDKLVSFKDSINELEVTYQQNLKESAEKAKLLEDDVFASLKTYIEERSRDTRKQINNVFEELKKSSLTYRTEIDNAYGESQSEITVWRTKLRKELDDGSADIGGRISAIETNFEEQLAVLKPRTEQMLAQVEEESRALVEGTKGDVFRRVENMISTVNEKESRLSEFEENLSYKLTRIEEITSDIDLLEDNLRQMVERAVEEVNSGFAGINEDMNSKWRQSSESLQADISSTRETMAALESELDSLKSRAYDNVSEQLKVFEDSFFDDLRAKSGVMEKQLEEWKTSVDSRLENISADAVTARQVLEQNYSSELGERIESLGVKTAEEYRRYELAVDNHENVVKEKLNNIDTSIDDMKTKLGNELEEANAELQNYLQAEFSKTRAVVDSDISKFMRDAEAGLKEAGAQVAAEREQMKERIEAGTAEIELWQARLNQQLSETETGLQEQYSAVKAESSERIAAIREQMAEQRNDFDSISGDILRRSRDIQAQLDEQLRGFDEKAAEITDGFSLANKRMFEKLDEQQRELSFTLSEIEKKQQTFISQTKIFERADTMKEALESGISDLQMEINRVTTQASEVREAEKKFLTIKKMAEDVTEKMNRFASDRRRIEEIDNDFQKLKSISQSVEMKINQITSADDSLQLVQARLMELDELQAELETRYDRLRKKETIVDSTIEGVDRGFKQLNDLDHMISVVTEKSSPLSSRLDELTRRIDFLSKNKKQIDTAIANIETIDSTLVDLEERIDRMQKAREWLAGTETRLEEVNKQAEEQVKLLGTLVKGSESKVKGGGAPPSEIRDIVIKLARQGWTVEQIAKSTQRSRGEVELILELQPKK